MNIVQFTLIVQLDDKIYKNIIITLVNMTFDIRQIIA